MYTFSLKSASSTFSRHCILLLTLLTTQSCPTLEIPRSGYFLGSPVLDLLKLKYTFPPPVQVWSRLSVLKFCCSFTHCVTDCLMSPKEVWAWQASHCVCECQHEREQAGNDGGQRNHWIIFIIFIANKHIVGSSKEQPCLGFRDYGPGLILLLLLLPPPSMFVPSTHTH